MTKILIELARKAGATMRCIASRLVRKAHRQDLLILFGSEKIGPGGKGSCPTEQQDNAEFLPDLVDY